MHIIAWLNTADLNYSTAPSICFYSLIYILGYELYVSIRRVYEEYRMA